MNKKSIKFKNRYDIVCPYCHQEMQCSPSLFHYSGMFDMGGGACIHCNKLMSIHYKPKSDSMVAVKFGDKEIVVH